MKKKMLSAEISLRRYVRERCPENLSKQILSRITKAMIAQTRVIRNEMSKEDRNAEGRRVLES